MARVRFVIAFLLGNFVHYSISADNAETKKLLHEYDKRVCENKPTCHLTDSVQKDRLTLKKRDCMCDFECSEYDDCCLDSQYSSTVSHNNNRRKYFCAPYSEVYMIADCPADYPDELTRINCEKGIQPLEEHDFDLIIPVTNTEKRITYANKYCAFCNNDENFETWDFYAGCGEFSKEFLNQANNRGYIPSFHSPSQANHYDNSFQSNHRNSLTRNKLSTTSRTTAHKKSGSKKEANIIENLDAVGCRVEESPCHVDESVPPPEPPKYIPTIVTAPEPTYVPIIIHQVPEYVIEASKFSHTSEVNIRVDVQQNVRRFKRQLNKMKINYAKYHNQVDELIDRATYDPNLKKFVVTSSEGKNLVCTFNSTYPKRLEDFVRICVPNVISDCRDKTSTCPSYTSIVYDKTQTPYRNRECAFCNGVKDNLKGCIQFVRQAASKDLVKTSKKTQEKNLEKIADSDLAKDAVGF